ncbi:hypothetical protein BGZ82_010827, partial [Podila clonocystis]
MASANTAIGLLPLALAAYSGGISLAAIIIRATIGNGFLGAVATYGLASEAISVHTPGFFDIIFYTQFILMTGQLAINYPSFYSTFTALFHWSFLAFKDSLAGNGPANATFVLTYGGAGSVNQINSSLNGNWPSAGINNSINHDNNERSMNDPRDDTSGITYSMSTSDTKDFFMETTGQRTKHPDIGVGYYYFATNLTSYVTSHITPNITSNIATDNSNLFLNFNKILQFQEPKVNIQKLIQF